MRRINPETGKEFKKGDIRKDGRIFWSYTKFVRKDGFFAEDWRSCEKFEMAKAASLKAIRHWKSRNKHKTNSYWAKRNAQKLQATPTWLSPSQLAEIEHFYAQAIRLSESSGIPYQVDHIIPLQGMSVCGLHVPWNLQVITAVENASKRNKHD